MSKMIGNALLVRRVCLSGRLAAIRCSTSSATTQSNDYFEKNERLGRPSSPWHIYKLQLTSVLSFTHRCTGMALSALLYGGGISALASQQTSFPQLLQSLQSTFPSSLLLTFKVLAGTSIAYHTFNGIRHLLWDYGIGFELKQLYISGYIVIGLSLLSAIAIILVNN